MTGVFSAANEQAVAMFLDKRIGYFDIYRTIELAMVGGGKSGEGRAPREERGDLERGDLMVRETSSCFVRI